MKLDLATVLSEEKASLAVECLYEEEKGQDKLGSMEVCYAWACEDLLNHKIAKSASATDTLLDFVYFGVPRSQKYHSFSAMAPLSLGKLRRCQRDGRLLIVVGVLASTDVLRTKHGQRVDQVEFRCCISL